MPVDLAAGYVGLSTSSLRGEVKAGLLKPVILTPRRIVYLKEDLDAYLDRKAGRSNTSAADAVNAWLTAK